MNIIERVQAILESFPKISEICNSIHIDFTDPEPTSYGLSSVGDELITEDILGGQTRQHTFMLYTTYSSINDYERLSNSSILTELSTWLEKQIDYEVDTTIGNETFTGVLTKLRGTNGMLIEVPQDNEYDGYQYQLQIIAEYTVEA